MGPRNLGGPHRQVRLQNHRDQGGDPFQPAISRPQARAHLRRFGRAANGMGKRGRGHGNADPASGRSCREQAGAKTPRDGRRRREAVGSEHPGIGRRRAASRTITTVSDAEEPPMAEKIVVFGAGATGRGHVGLLAWQAGFEIVFVDKKPALVDALRAKADTPSSSTASGSQEIVVSGYRRLPLRGPRGDCRGNPRCPRWC